MFQALNAAVRVVDSDGWIISGQTSSVEALLRKKKKLSALSMVALEVGKSIQFRSNILYYLFSKKNKKLMQSFMIYL